MNPKAQLKLEKGFTTCKTCRRHLARKDADRNGNCCDCAPESFPEQVAGPEPQYKLVPAEDVL